VGVGSALLAALLGGVGGFAGSWLAHRDSRLDRVAARFNAAVAGLGTDTVRAQKVAQRMLELIAADPRSGEYQKLAEAMIDTQLDKTLAAVTPVLESDPTSDVVLDDDEPH
jgi:hypothetical protein